MIDVDKIFDLMADEGFQQPSTGNLFFPAYVYTYPADKEYEVREQIQLLNQKLQRPNNYLDCLVINMYKEIIDYLKSESFAGKSLFELVLEKEKEDPEDATRWVREEINEGGFYNHFERQIKNHFKKEESKRVYLIIHGFGTSFPYLRASEFLKNTEKLIKEFKIILFYPGSYSESRYSLFGELNDDNMYRANYLNRQLGEEN